MERPLPVRRCYLGGTGCSSIKLDDYEEGTWTPVITDGTNDATMYTAAGNGGRYTKIGRAVTYTAHITVETIDSVGAGAVISGLPFTWNAGSYRAAAAIGYGASLNLTAGRVIAGYVNNQLTLLCLNGTLQQEPVLQGHI